MSLSSEFYFLLFILLSYIKSNTKRFIFLLSEFRFAAILWEYSYFLKTLSLFIFLIIIIDIPNTNIRHLFFYTFLIFIYLIGVYYDNKKFINSLKNLSIIQKKLYNSFILILSLLINIYIMTLVSNEVIDRTGFPISFYYTSIQAMFFVGIIIIYWLLLLLFLVLFGAHIYLAKLICMLHKGHYDFKRFFYYASLFCFAMFIFPYHSKFIHLIYNNIPIVLDSIFVKTGFYDVPHQCINRGELIRKYGKDIKVAIIDTTIISIAIPDKNGRYDFKTDTCSHIPTQY